MLTAGSTLHDALVRVSEVTRGICALPAVPTLDWFDRTANALAQVAAGGVALVVYGTVDETGQITTTDAVGVGSACDQSVNDTTLSALRGRGHRLGSIGWAPVGDGPMVGKMDELAPSWRVEGIGRVWSGNVRGELIAGVAPIPAVGGKSLAVFLDTKGGEAAGDEANSVLSAVLPFVAEVIADRIGPTLANPRGWLTPREQEVLDQLALGKSVKQIAEALARSPHTVHDHVKALHRKLNANTRGELIARALGHLSPREENGQALHAEPKPVLNPPPAGLPRPGGAARSGRA